MDKQYQNKNAGEILSELFFGHSIINHLKKTGELEPETKQLVENYEIYLNKIIRDFS